MTTLVDLMFKASTDQLDKAQDKLKGVATESKAANQEVDRVGSAFSRLSGPVQVAVSGTLIFASAALSAAAAAVKLTLAVSDAQDELNDLANRSNIAAQRLSLLDAVAKMAGSSAEELVGSAERLGSKLARQNEESGRAVEALKQLGLSTKEANGEQKSMLALQEEIVLAVENATDRAKAEGAAVQLLGNEYYKLKTPIKEAHDASYEMYSYMRNVGAVVTAQMAKDSDELNDKISKMKLAYTGMANSIAEVVRPVLTKLIEQITVVSEAAARTIRRWSGLSTRTEAGQDALSTAEVNYKAAVAGAAKASNPDSAYYKPAQDNLAKRTQELEDARRALFRASEADDAEMVRTVTGAKREGNRPAGITKAPKEPKEKAEAKDPHLSYIDAYKKQQEALAEFNKGQEEIDKLMAKYAADLQKVIDAEDEKLKTSKRSVAENRIQIDVMKRVGATQQDVNAALADYSISLAETELAIARAKNANSDEVVVLQKKLDVLKQIRANEAEKRADNDAAVADANTFGNGWDKAFDSYKKEAANAAKMGERAFTSAAQGMEDAIVKFAMTGKLSFGDLARSILADLARIAIKKAITGLFSLGLNMFEKGGAFSSGVQMYAKGDVFNTPTAFNPGNGKLGVMGEAGPEAIMPLKRGADGKLGVSAQGGGDSIVQQSIQINVTVEGGSNADETGAAVAMKVQELFVRGIVKQELKNDTRRRAYAV